MDYKNHIDLGQQISPCSNFFDSRMGKFGIAKFLRQVVGSFGYKNCNAIQKFALFASTLVHCSWDM